MKSLSDTPSPSVLPDQHDLLAKTPTCRKQVLQNVCNKIVERFIDFEFNKKDEKSAGKQSSGKQSSGKQSSGKQSAGKQSAGKQSAGKQSADKQSTGKQSAGKQSDGVRDYTMRLLGLGCFYMEYADAIKEGDGERVIRCWRYLLPIFKSSGRKNYSIEAFTLLNQYEYQLTPRQSAQLVWNRFINTHGIRGRNIPCDLHQEHLNRICKRAIRNLGANQTETAITRAGKVLGTLYPVLMQYDMQTHVADTTGIHRAPTSQKDRDVIIRELQRLEVFSSLRKRKYHTFPRPRDPLHAKSHDEIEEWITKHLICIDQKK